MKLLQGDAAEFQRLRNFLKVGVQSNESLLEDSSGKMDFGSGIHFASEIQFWSEINFAFKINFDKNYLKFWSIDFLAFLVTF